MGRTGFKFTVKTPHKTWKCRDVKESNNIFHNEIENNMSKVLINEVSTSAKAMQNQTLSVIATFFQRVCSRTPLDEIYEVSPTRKPHIPDNEQCRYDWKIRIGGNELTSMQIKEELGEEVFLSVNDLESVKKIKDCIKKYFGNADYTQVEILNESPHFNVLEYGGYHSQKHEEGENKGKWNDNNWSESSDIKQGEYYEHGVENYHSVQAPVGMLRITEMELESQSLSDSATVISKRFKGERDGRNVTPTDAKLREFRELLKKKKIRYGDISRYLDK